MYIFCAMRKNYYSKLLRLPGGKWENVRTAAHIRSLNKIILIYDKNRYSFRSGFYFVNPKVLLFISIKSISQIQVRQRGGKNLYELISNLKSIFSNHKIPGPIPEKTKLNDNLISNLDYIRRRFDYSCDLMIHEIKPNGIRCAVISIDNMINKDILGQAVLKPLYSYDFSNKTSDECMKTIETELLYIDDISRISTFEEVYRFILSGFAVLALDGCNQMLSIGVQGYQSRSISEPESDVVQRGSKEGFVEPIRTNMSLLRRRMKTPELKFEILTAGNLSKTEICLCYLNNAVSKDILAEVKKRINAMNIDTVFAAGYMVSYLEDSGGISPFRSIGITERPDTLCGKLTEGRIGILIDGVPSALIVPYLFAEYFQTLDDYSNRPYFAAFTRLLKFAAFIISILLPGIYTALGSFNPEMFPTLMLNKIAVSIGDTPLSLMSETLLILLVYEIMRESGLRMPQPLGYAVSIVGGLVIGDTAINAGLIGAPTLMVVAISAICSYIIPNLYAPAAILRIVFTIIGGTLGIWGIAAAFCMVCVNLCSRTSFGIPYTSPITPFGATALRDVFFRADWKTLSLKNEKIQNMPGAAGRRE